MFGLDEKELKIFLERSLNEKEKKVLLNSFSLQGESFSSIVRKLNLPESTAKYNLKKLKQKNLLDFGDSAYPGKPLTFTPLGYAFVQVLRGHSIEGVRSAPVGKPIDSGSNPDDPIKINIKNQRTTEFNS